MSDFMGIIFFVLFTLFALLCVGGVVYLVIYLARNKEKKINLTKDTLLGIYFYLLSLVTLGVAVIGSVVLLNSIFAHKINTPFSYEVQELNTYDPEIDFEDYRVSDFQTCYMGKEIEIEGEKVCFDPNTPKKALATGASLTLSMLILFVIHRLAVRDVEKKGKIMWLKKAYNFISLIIYSAISIIAIPASLYLTLNYIYFRPDTITRIDPPGYMLSLALLSIPLWIYFLVRTLRLKEEK